MEREYTKKEMENLNIKIETILDYIKYNGATLTWCKELLNAECNEYTLHISMMMNSVKEAMKNAQTTGRKSAFIKNLEFFKTALDIEIRDWSKNATRADETMNIGDKINVRFTDSFTKKSKVLPAKISKINKKSFVVFHESEEHGYMCRYINKKEYANGEIAIGR